MYVGSDPMPVVANGPGHSLALLCLCGPEAPSSGPGPALPAGRATAVPTFAKDFFYAWLFFPWSKELWAL